MASVQTHTHASEAIADGYSLLEVADRLGHTSPKQPWISISTYLVQKLENCI